MKIGHIGRMFGFGHFLNQPKKFFVLLISAAQEAVDSVEDLESFMETPPTSRQAALLSGHKDREQDIARRIEVELLRTFVTEMDRDDIKSVADALHRIPKAIDLLAKHVIAAGVYAQDINFKNQIQSMGQATEVLLSMTETLQHSRRLARAQNRYRKMRRIYERAEEDRMNLIGELYSGKYEPMQAMALHDLYLLCEKILDRCEAAAGVILHVFLKNN